MESGGIGFDECSGEVNIRTEEEEAEAGMSVIDLASESIASSSIWECGGWEEEAAALGWW